MLLSLLYILYIIQCWHKKVSHNLEKKLIKVSQKRGKIIYLYKSVDIIFLLHLKFYQNFKNYHARKWNKTDLVNVCFPWPSRTVLSFYFALTSKLNDTLHSFGKRFYAKFLCFCEIFSCLDPLALIMNLSAGNMVFW